MTRSLITAVAVLLIGARAFAGPATEIESVGTGGGEEIGSEVGRSALTVINLDSTNPVCCAYVSTVTCSGGSGTDGQRIVAGAGYTWNSIHHGQPVAGHEIYCRASGAAVSVSYDEVKD